MGHIVDTAAGSYRANWRGATGRQRSKAFRTKKEARAFLAQIEADLTRGSYVDPAAGRALFGDLATRWLASRNDEITTAPRDASIMRTHVVPRWGSWPLGKIDHLAVQEWVSELAGRLAPATVAQCFRLMNAVTKSAVRNRLIPFNPCEDVRLPRERKKDSDGVTITREELRGKLLPLLPVLPDRYRALVGTAAGTGLRWGECIGLRWDCVDLDGGRGRRHGELEAVPEVEGGPACRAAAPVRGRAAHGAS
jgi:integrase